MIRALRIHSTKTIRLLQLHPIGTYWLPLSQRQILTLYFEFRIIKTVSVSANNRSMSRTRHERHISRFLREYITLPHCTIIHLSFLETCCDQSCVISPCMEEDSRCDACNRREHTISARNERVCFSFLSNAILKAEPSVSFLECESDSGFHVAL